MKSRYLSAILSFLAVFGCNKLKQEAAPILKLSVSETFVNPVGEDLSITLLTDQDWTAASEAEWLDVLPLSGLASDSKQSIVISVQENDTDKERIGKVIFRTASLEQSVILHQDVPSESALRGRGTEEYPYIISIPAHFKEVRESMAKGSTTYVCLGADIDMKDVTFRPFNNQSPYDKVIHFDGKGFTISNLTCHAKTYPGFFGILNGSCSNLEIIDASIENDEAPCGIIAASAPDHVVLNNVHVSGKVRSGKGGVAGLIGTVCGATIENCTADIDVSSSQHYVGGLVGQVKSGKLMVRNSSVSGRIYGEGKVGGLVGGSLKAAAVELYDSYSSASVTGHGYLGGFAGYLDNDASNPVKIVNCHATGEVTSTSHGLGDLSAFVSDVYAGCEIVDCSATGTVRCRVSGNQTEFAIGGIIARAISGNSKTHLKNCSYKGVLRGHEYMGGVVGYSKGDITIEDCYAEGDLTSSLSVGGILGVKDDGEADITRCHFKGNLAGGGGIGGIVGYLTQGIAYISESWSEGQMTSNATDIGGLFERYSDGLGGIVGSSNIHVTIENCCSSADVTGMHSQAAGGILGIGKSTAFIKDCHASGAIKAKSGVGGLVGVFNRVSNAELHTSIAWNKSVETISGQMDVYTSGAVIGSIDGSVTLTDNYRRNDFDFNDFNATELCDHENVINSLPPLPEGAPDDTRRTYHGKAAEPGLSLAALAEKLGWDGQVWDFSSEVSLLPSR